MAFSPDQLYEASNLTRAQCLVWVGQALAPADPMYNMALAVPLPEDLDIEAFQRAVSTVWAASDAMCSVYVTQDGIPQRKVRPDMAKTTHIVDLSAETLSDAQVDAWIAQRAQRPFDLTETLVDSVVLKLSQGRFVWALNQHHLITDGVSLQAQMQAIRTAYDGPQIAGLPSYESFSAFERAQSESPQGKARATHWDKVSQAPINSPILRAQGAAKVSSAARRVKRPIPPELLDGLNTLGAASGIRMFSRNLTQFHIHATALLALSHRLSDAQDVTIGTSSANRPTPDSRNTIGLCVELYPLDVSVTASDTFQTLYAKVQKSAQAVLSNAYPGASSAALQRRFNTLLNYITAQIAFDPQAGPTRWIHPGSSDPGHHLRVEVEDFAQSGTANLLFDISTDVFGQSDNIADQYIAMLQAFTNDPNALISNTDLGAQPVIGPISETSGTILDLFETQCAARPQAAAVTANSQTLSYADLAQRANTIAAHLSHTIGIRPGQNVGIYAQRSTDMVAAMYGVLSCGAAFVPLDPAFPEARLEMIAQDTDLAAILVPDHVDDCLRALPCPSIALRDLPTETQTSFQRAAISSHQRAYVIYTSGSTGTPNGVCVSHANVASLVHGLRTQIYDNAPAGLSVALLAPLVFDAALQQVFGATLQGHNLCIVDESSRMDGAALAAFYETHKVDLTDGTPAHLTILAEGAEPCPPHIPSRFVIGGDTLTRNRVDGFFKWAKDHAVTVTNIYGVAECCVDSVSFDVTRETLPDLPADVPLGVPLPNAEIRILNAAGTMMPVGVEGQIAIAGPGVSQGYQNRADLTNARFIPHPDTPDAFLYLTGDIGWIDHKGRVRFSGRRDDQVKVRGIRIELGEIEHHLGRYSAPSQAPLDLAQPKDISSEATRCATCLLTTDHPGIEIDSLGQCSECANWTTYESAAQTFFQGPEAFRDLTHLAATQRPEASEYDCMLLFSGGKDSSYVLHRLVEQGLRVLAFTFDNGFISKAAFQAIERQTKQLGVTSIVRKTARMDDIFVESLRLDDTVCSGCFRALTAISTQLAHEYGINMVVTGLSRGQIFDTKLSGLYRQGITDLAQVEENLQLFRRVFHANQDRTAHLLDVDLAQVDTDEIHFVDFFRYDPAGVNDVRRYLSERDTYWQQPGDTGFCSTNCLMNDVGICVHSKRRNYHNYDAPLSWDIRLGVARRDDVLTEVTAPVNLTSATTILHRIGFFTTRVTAACILPEDQGLTAYFTATQTVEPAALRTFLAEKLPSYMLPSRYVQIDHMPLTQNGKIDKKALGHKQQLNALDAAHVPPETAEQKQLCDIMTAVLKVENVGIHDNFFDLGGDSIAAIQIISRAVQQGLSLTAADLLQSQTVAKLALRIGQSEAGAPPAQGEVKGPVAPNDVMSRYLAHTPKDGLPVPYAQTFVLRHDGVVDRDRLEQAAHAVLAHHDALRMRAVWKDATGWTILQQPTTDTAPLIMDLSRVDDTDASLGHLTAQLHLDKGITLAIGLHPLGDDHHNVLIAVHHICVDAVSFPILIEDLLRAYQGTKLPSKTTSFQAWTQLCAHPLSSKDRLATQRFWRAEPQASDLFLLPKSDQSGPQQRYKQQMSLDLTTKVRTLQRATSGQSPAVLLTALAGAFTAGTDRTRCQFDVEHNGRWTGAGWPDISRSVGWFTAIFPMTISTTGSPQSQISATADLFETLPGKGGHFGRLPAKDRHSYRPSDILFNDLGQDRGGMALPDTWQIEQHLDARWSTRPETTYPVEINTFERDGHLNIWWDFDAGQVSQGYVQDLADRLTEMLTDLTQDLTPPDKGRPPRRRFSKSKLSASKLDKLGAALGRIDGQGSSNDA